MCCSLWSCYTLGCVVWIYSVWIVLYNGVVAVNKITADGVFYIAWLGVALKLYGSAWECGLFGFVCDLYCRSLFIPLLCDLLVLVTTGVWLQWVDSRYTEWTIESQFGLTIVVAHNLNDTNRRPFHVGTEEERDSNQICWWAGQRWQQKVWTSLT